MDICLYLCGWLDLVWQLCPDLSYWLGSMSNRLFVILYMVESLASALLCSRVGPVLDPLKIVDVSGGICMVPYYRQQYSGCGRTRLHDALGNRLKFVSFNESKLSVCFIDYLVDVWVPGEV